MGVFFFFFFFQAEDGIRDVAVTGVQTCALPISLQRKASARHFGYPLRSALHSQTLEIGRASCRERVYISVAAVSLKKRNDEKGKNEILKYLAEAKMTQGDKYSLGA